MLFKERGYSAVSMRDIAEACNIKASSLYNHIASKQEILTTIIISLAEEFTIGMSEILKDDSDWKNKIKQIINMHIRITRDNQNEMASLNNDWMHLNESQGYYLKMRKSYEQNFKFIIAQGIADGSFKRTNEEIALFSILTTLRSLYIWMPDKLNKSAEDLNLELSEVLLEGII